MNVAVETAPGVKETSPEGGLISEKLTFILLAFFLQNEIEKTDGNVPRPSFVDVLPFIGGEKGIMGTETARVARSGLRRRNGAQNLINGSRLRNLRLIIKARR